MNPPLHLRKRKWNCFSRCSGTCGLNGVGAIYISHRLEEIFTLADRVTVLRDGQSVGTNAVDDINEAQLIRMMVGREVSTIYPPADTQPANVVFQAQNLGCAAQWYKKCQL